MKKILIIEDDKGISTSLKLYLENSNYEVFIHNEWLEAIKKVKQINPDLIVLDINLPWKNWIEITKELRYFSIIPIIMLTARTSELDKISWFEVWADDYIAKPFSPRELLARINTIIRRISLSNTSNIEKEFVSNKDLISFWWIELNINKRTVTNQWKTISLTSNEYEILKKIFKAKWWIISRETIMKEIIWYENYLYDRTIDTHIKNIRKKIWQQDLILTVRWEWYRINN